MKMHFDEDIILDDEECLVEENNIGTIKMENFELLWIIHDELNNIEHLIKFFLPLSGQKQH